jgi:Domain of unknown function (DUF4175)
MHTPSGDTSVQVLDRPVPAESVSLVGKLETTRHDMRSFRRSRCLLQTALAVLLLLGLLALTDWLWVLGPAVRAAGLLGVGAAAAVLLGRGLVLPRQQLGRLDAAAEVEAGFPELGQRVRTTLEYAEPTPATMPAAPGLVAALTTDTDRRTTGLDFRGLIPWRSLRWLRLELLGVLAAFAVALVAVPELRIAARRALLLPGAYTHLDVTPGDHAIKAGGEVAVQATLTGRPVATAELQHRPAGGADEWTAVSLAPPELAGTRSKLSGTLETRLKDCQQDLDYRIVAGPVQSQVYRLTVLHPLLLKQTEAVVEPPAYTRRSTATVKEGNFKVIAGSHVRFRFTLDREPQSAKLLIHADGQPATPVELRREGAVLVGELAAVDKELEYEIAAEAADGMKLDAGRFRIQVQPDRKPTVRFLRPAERIEVSATTEVTLRVEANDDFGLAKIGIVYQIGNGPKKTHTLKAPSDQPVTFKLESVLALEEYPLTHRDSITYYAFAEDNHPNSPQRAMTDLQFIDIRPYKRAYQFVEGQDGPRQKDTSVTLEELIHRQRANLNKTFHYADQKPVEKRVAQRLAKTEHELAAATNEFRTGLEERVGPVPTLQEAEDAMNQAAQALDQRELKPAVPLQETAVAALIQARENLRKLLSDKSSSGPTRNFDLEQAQKLRRPPKKDDKEEVAQLQEEVEKLAREEKKFSEEMETKTGGGAQLDPKDTPKKQEKAQAKGGSGSSAGPAERQDQAAKKAVRIQELMQEDERITDLAHVRMENVTRTIRKSAKDARAGKEKESGKGAASAAEQLERLARQLAALRTPDLPARLARAQQMARDLAKQQQGLNAAMAEKGAEEKQRGLSEEARTLADLIDRIEEDAAEVGPQHAQALRQAKEAAPPKGIVEDMRRAADELQAGRPDEARRDGGQSAEKLETLAQHLEAVRRALVEPELAKLLAAEQQAAQAQEAMQSVSSDAQKAEAERKLGELRDTMQNLAQSDDKLGEAADQLADALRNGGPGRWGQPDDRMPDGHRVIKPPPPYQGSVARVIQVLQMRIQEIILKDALLDRDEPVPPRFKALVEEYYRVLSEDIR